MCLSSQLDASPFSTSTDSMLKPCAMGLLSLHSSRRAETDALEHVALFGNLQNRDSTEPQREKNRLAYQYMLSMFLDQVNEAQDEGGWLITYKGETEPRVCIPVTMCFVLDYEEVRRSGLIKSGATQYPMFNCLKDKDELADCTADGSCTAAPRTMAGMWEGEDGGTHEQHCCSSSSVIPAFANTRGPTEPYELCLIDWLHAIAKGAGLNVKDSIFDVIRDMLGSRGERELNNIFADWRNRFIGGKYFRQGISSLSNEQAYEVSADPMSSLAFVTVLTLL